MELGWRRALAGVRRAQTGAGVPLPGGCDPPGLAALPVPGAFLLQDGGHTERIELLRLEGEQGILAAPLEQKHSRGRELLPAQPYTADRQGVVEALLCQPCQLTVQCRGQVKTFDLAPGENQGQWQLEGR